MYLFKRSSTLWYHWILWGAFLWHQPGTRRTCKGTAIPRHILSGDCSSFLTSVDSSWAALSSVVESNGCVLSCYQVAINFWSHGKEFRLRLKRDAETFSPGFIAENSVGADSVDTAHLFFGHLHGMFQWNICHHEISILAYNSWNWVFFSSQGCLGPMFMAHYMMGSLRVTLSCQKEPIM